jgi:hypothetical protein
VGKNKDGLSQGRQWSKKGKTNVVPDSRIPGYMRLQRERERERRSSWSAPFHLLEGKGFPGFLALCITCPR